MQLLAQARHALEEGRIDDARQLAIEAERLKVVYGVFDDRPDLVIQDIAKVATKPSSKSFGAASLPEDVRAGLGIDDGLVRLSVGIESIDDLIAELKYALE